MSTAADAAVTLGSVTKRFGDNKALDEVDFQLRRGEIHALIGENGAGKSTLARIIAGLEQPTEGRFELGGHGAKDLGRREAMDRGVGFVQQHFTLVPTYTAEENIALSRPTQWVTPGRRQLAKRLGELSQRYQLDVRPGIPVSRLSVGERQRVEILRALDADAEVLLLDEPTAVLVDAEADRLLALCRELADEGKAIMIVTHRLGEVLQAADRATVLRHGKVVLSAENLSGYTRGELAAAMVGTEMVEQDRAEARPSPDLSQDPVLSVENLSLGRLTDCSLTLHPGEVIGIAGVDGNGQAELESVLAGHTVPEKGSVNWHARKVRHRRPRDRAAAGVAYIASDRHEHALAMPLELADNLELGRSRIWRASRSSRRRAAEARLAHWDVRGGTASTPAGALSGGNAQKVVLSRELNDDPDIILACYPTRGLDPGAARSISDRVLDAVENRRAAALWFGAELDELLAVADRIVVLVTGHSSVELQAPFDRDQIALAMAGVKVDA